ncbi:hypothetical protein ES703_45640 [subsurface metagenome]
MAFYSPLRYPGGKNKLSNFFKELIEENSLKGGWYIETYAGGSSVAISLLLEGYVSKIIMNDIDRSIYAFWHSILFETNKLCNMIKKIPVTINTWKKQKKIQKEKEKHSLLKLGFSTFFLNRTNISGIINAGAIGGLKQINLWKIDARYNKENLIKRIKLISKYKNQIEIYNEDAMKFIKIISKKLPKKTLFYFDPPYYVKGKQLYLNFYNDEDHKVVARTISNIKGYKWVITYDNVPFIKKIYSNFKKRVYSLNYSAGHSHKGEEIMIFSKNLIPKPPLKSTIKSPTFE